MADYAFAYRELPDGHIRLLKIRQSSPTQPDPLHLEIYTYEIASAPVYQAISYVWGRPSTDDRYRMLCHDMIDEHKSGPAEVLGSGHFQLTPNLHEALPFILKHYDGLIWIDAVCINQQDEEEKARVVAQMHEYYSQAQEVLIWYGPAANDSGRVIQLLNDFYAYYLSEFNTIERGRSLEQGVPTENGNVKLTLHYALYEYLYGEDRSSAEKLLPPASDPIWDNFRAFCGRDWLTRVWTYQEAVLAPKGTLLCGHSTISYAAFGKVVQDWTQTTSLFWRGTTYGDPHSPMTSEITSLYSGLFLNLGRLIRKDQRWGSQLKWYPWWDTLDAMRMRACAVAQDRIYGVLALASKEIRTQIAIKYSTDPHAVSDLYVHVNNLYLRAESTSLSHVLDWAAGQEAADGMPTWCVDWRRPKLPSSPNTRFWDMSEFLRRFAWRDHTSADVGDANILRVRGIQIGQVKSTFSEWADDKRFHEWIEGEAMLRGGPDVASVAFMLIRDFLRIMSVSWTNYLVDWANDLLQPGRRLPEPFKIPRGVSDQLQSYNLLSLSHGRLGLAPRSTQVGDIAVMFCSEEQVYLLRPLQELDEAGNVDYSYVGRLGHEIMQGADWVLELQSRLEASPEEAHAEILKPVESRLRIFSIK